MNIQNRKREEQSLENREKNWRNTRKWGEEQRRNWKRQKQARKNEDHNKQWRSFTKQIRIESSPKPQNSLRHFLRYTAFIYDIRPAAFTFVTSSGFALRRKHT